MVQPMRHLCHTDVQAEEDNKWTQYCSLNSDQIEIFGEWMTTAEFRIQEIESV